MIGAPGRCGEPVGGKVAAMPRRHRPDLRRSTEDFDGRATLSTLDQVLQIRVGRDLRGGRNAPDEACGVRPGGGGTLIAACEIDLDDGRLTPELIELIRRTFRGMHLLAHLKREELAAKGKEDAFKRAAEAGELGEAQTFDHEDSNGED